MILYMINKQTKKIRYDFINIVIIYLKYVNMV